MMQVGQTAKVTRSYSAADLTEFATLSGCDVPQTTVPEPLIAALFSYLLGVHLPGPGTNYLKQDLHFPAPAPLEVELTATVEIVRLRSEKHLVDLWARCTTPEGTVVCEGRSLVKAKDVGA
ncbi:phosphate acetyltransferase [Actibacterium sp.]|uniref:phosphate acetyltransferase n=1 Tax=Actibacterium sp. TaxID=1872125 RepID=UPI003563F6C4